MLLVYVLAPVFSLLFFFSVLVHLLKRHKNSVRQERDHLLDVREPPCPAVPNKSIQILETLHEGQFATVFKAKYADGIVAVKSVQPLLHELWTNEKDIFESCILQHGNVLQFIGAEKRQFGSDIQYWIITEYCPGGSLGDYLCKYTLILSDLIRMTLCILKGLDYLHSSNSSSLTIAHRDLKSSNILVKSDLTCCIADFGLSIAFSLKGESGKPLDTHTSQVGTKRYMAPEVLRGAMTFYPESFVAVDMYAFALVAWELLSRTATLHIVPDSYELPYNRELGCIHPSLGNMIQCVVEKNKRPAIKDKWRLDPVLNILCETIEECWDVDAYARVGARLAYLRISRLSVEDNFSNENVSSSSGKVDVKCIESSESTNGHVIMLDKAVPS